MSGNPFAALSSSVSPGLMQAYVVLMVVLVVGGTLFDVWHKGSARYFFDNWRRSRGDRRVGGGRLAGLAVQTAAVEVLTSGEFCNPQRRLSHLLTMYGFVFYALATAILVFGYPAAPGPWLVTLMWYLGVAMICGGGGWFWFFIRVDVLAEGHSPLRVVRADLFILSLVSSAAFGLIWAVLETAGAVGSGLFLVLYLIATTVLFGSVPWSKFSHMFFKPAAAFQKRVETVEGFRSHLPAPADKPAVLGGERAQPRHY